MELPGRNLGWEDSSKTRAEAHMHVHRCLVGR